MNLLKIINSPAYNRVRSPTGKQPAIIHSGPLVGGFPSNAEKLSAVFACMEIRSNDLGSLPNYIINRETKERWTDHPILELLNVRPNLWMTPLVRRKLLSYSIDNTGNAYDWILRNPSTGQPEELIPLTGDLVTRHFDKQLNLWYQVTNPLTGNVFWLPQEDVCDYKGPTHDGFNGLSKLSFASEVTAAGLAAQTYNRRFYESGGQPSGILTVETDLTGYEYDAENQPTGRTTKDVLRDEWEKYHSGAENSNRIAILDHGLKYQPLTISQKDSQFVEQHDQTIEDIARYFSMPLYKLSHGKQSYNSNEQNAIEYAGSLRPEVIQREQEQTWKLLSPSEVRAGWAVSTNMMAVLRSDSASRMAWYRGMREIGPFSVNDILALEDLPPVPGGDTRQASLNYVPLEDWPELSRQRAGSGAGKEKNE